MYFTKNISFYFFYSLHNSLLFEPITNINNLIFLSLSFKLILFVYNENRNIRYTPQKENITKKLVQKIYT